LRDIPGVMGRSNLRAKQTEGGYNLVDVRTGFNFIYRKKKNLCQGELKNMDRWGC